MNIPCGRYRKIVWPGEKRGVFEILTGNDADARKKNFRNGVIE
jgi:hypothetical protein